MRRRGARRRDGRLRRRRAARGRERGRGHPARGRARLRAARLGSAGRPTSSTEARSPRPTPGATTRGDLHPAARADRAPARPGDRRLLRAQRLHRRGRLPGGLRRLGPRRRGRGLGRGRAAAAASPARSSGSAVRHYAEDEIGPVPPRLPRRGCGPRAPARGRPRRPRRRRRLRLEPVNVEGGVRINAAFAYLDPARDRPNLRVVDRALCDRLVAGPRRGRGRRVARRRRAARPGERRPCWPRAPTARRRSCCAPGSASRTCSAPHGIATVHSLPGVGRNLHDHPLVELDFGGSDRLRRRSPTPAPCGSCPRSRRSASSARAARRGPYDLHLIPVAAPEHSLLAGRTLLAVGAMEPRSRGRLRLASTDPDAAPVMDHGYLTDPDATTSRSSSRASSGRASSRRRSRCAR